MVHVARHSLTSAPAGGPKPTVIGSAVTIGHGATLHACTIGDGCLVRALRVVLYAVDVLLQLGVWWLRGNPARPGVCVVALSQH